MAREINYWVPLKALIHGILAVALSFTAYSKRVKTYEVSNFSGYCAYPSSSAWYYGLIAAVALLAEQVTICVGMRCFCSRKVHFTKRCIATISLIFFVFSWFAFVISFMGLIYTAVVNNHKFLVKHHSHNNGGGCFIGKENLFLGAAIWCVITTVLGLISYGFWACSTDSRDNSDQAEYANSYGQGGVAMGQPHTQLSKEQC